MEFAVGGSVVLFPALVLCSLALGGCAMLVLVDDVLNICPGESATVEASSTCGITPDPSEYFFGEWGRSGSVFETLNCSASSPSISLEHSPSNVLDPSTDTWWQSESGPGHQNVSVTLFLPNMTVITESTWLPRAYQGQRLRLLGSSDGGSTWRTLQEYARSCFGRINGFMKPRSSHQDLVGNLDVKCTLSNETFEDPAETRYSPAARVGMETLVANRTLRRVVEVDALRLEMSRPYAGRSADPSSQDARFLYYGLYSWKVRGFVPDDVVRACQGCPCNNHSEECVGSRSTFSLACRNCQHGTSGDTCGECQEGYYPNPLVNVTDVDACLPCNCSAHASECFYNNVTRQPECINCTDGTEGGACERCRSTFYRNPDVMIAHPDTCLSCACGGLNCTLNSTQGQLTCLDCDPANATCVRCLPGFYLDLNGTDPMPSCTVCECNDHAGACLFNASARAMQCIDCQHSTTGASCNLCAPGFVQNTSLDVSARDACYACPCNGHASACQQNASALEPECIDCLHNTIGERCHICAEGFRRNSSLAISHPQTCYREASAPVDPFEGDRIENDDYLPLGIALACLAALVLLFVLAVVSLAYARQRKLAFYAVAVESGSTPRGQHILSTVRLNHCNDYEEMPRPVPTVASELAQSVTTLDSTF